MSRRCLAVVIAFALGLGLLEISVSTHAQQPTKRQDLLDAIIEEVIDQTLSAARETIRRNTGVDLSERGYDLRKTYRPLPYGASDETRRELRKLEQEHDRKVAQLEQELQRKLDKARAEFEREAAKEDKAEKVAEKGDTLEHKVDEAYAKFEEKIAEANETYDEKREKIISKERGG